MNYLLDTSAWLAHLFGEAGALEIREIFNDPHAQVFVSVLSLWEVHARLKALCREEQWPVVYSAYASVFVRILPVDEQVVVAAIQLRAATPARLPTVDGLIAATGVVHNLTLVHRDAHFASIPGENVRQIQLPDQSQLDPRPS